MMVSVSQNLKSIIFANGFEGYLLEEKNGKYFQRNILKYSKHHISFVKEDI